MLGQRNVLPKQLHLYVIVSAKYQTQNIDVVWVQKRRNTIGYIAENSTVAEGILVWRAI